MKKIDELINALSKLKGIGKKNATRIAFDQASAGDVVLLSPANASWDMYKNFEVRGDEFITTVEQLKG